MACLISISSRVVSLFTCSARPVVRVCRQRKFMKDFSNALTDRRLDLVPLSPHGCVPAGQDFLQPGPRPHPLPSRSFQYLPAKEHIKRFFLSFSLPLHTATLFATGTYNLTDFKLKRRCKVKYGCQVHRCYRCHLCLHRWIFEFCTEPTLMKAGHNFFLFQTLVVM